MNNNQALTTLVKALISIDSATKATFQEYLKREHDVPNLMSFNLNPALTVEEKAELYEGWTKDLLEGNVDRFQSSVSKKLAPQPVALAMVTKEPEPVQEFEDPDYGGDEDDPAVLNEDVGFFDIVELLRHRHELDIRIMEAVVNYPSPPSQSTNELKGMIRAIVREELRAIFNKA